MLKFHAASISRRTVLFCVYQTGGGGAVSWNLDGLADGSVSSSVEDRRLYDCLPIALVFMILNIISSSACPDKIKLLTYLSTNFPVASDCLEPVS